MSVMFVYKGLEKLNPYYLKVRSHSLSPQKGKGKLKAFIEM